jgi:hypothetical protein
VKTFKQFLEARSAIEDEQFALMQKQQQELAQARASGDVNLWLKLAEKHKAEIQALQAKLRQAGTNIPPVPPEEKRVLNNPPDFGLGNLFRKNGF